MLSTIPGAIGLIVQFFIAISVFSSLRTRSFSFALLAGAIAATFGYGLVLSFLMLFAIPWQFTNVLFAAFFVVLSTRSGYRLSITRGINRLWNHARSSWGSVVILIGVVAFNVLINALKPELSVDGQLYHGPILGNIVSTGTLWGWGAPNQYIFYTDLTMASSVNLATFTGTVWFDDAAQVPYLLIFMLAVIWALRSRFRSTLLRTALALLIVSAPVIWLQARIMYVDLAYGTAVLVAGLMVAFIKKWGRAEIMVAATAVAAIFATKPAGILTGALCALAVLVSVAVHESVDSRSFSATSRSLLRTILYALLPLIAASSFYIRNFISFSNPVYPVQVSFGRIHFPGLIDMSVFMSGDRGSGLFDLGRWGTYLQSLIDGATNGIAKHDYDPRAGGYGHAPLLLLCIVGAILVVEAIMWCYRRNRNKGKVLKFWIPQIILLGLASIVLAVQPSSFDTRYVIGPTTLLEVAAILTTFGVLLPLLAELLAAALAIILALGQIVWTETHMYPGLSTILSFRTLSASQQPLTFGNPWGGSTMTNWLPAASCVSLALETDGGLGPGGLVSSSELGTLPYALWGDHLCNRVTPVQLSQFGETGSTSQTSATHDPIPSSQFFVMYSKHVDAWQKTIPNFSTCWVFVQTLPGNIDYPEDESVYKNLCVGN